MLTNALEVWYYKQAPERGANERREAEGLKSLEVTEFVEELDEGRGTAESGQEKALCKLNNTKNKQNPEINLSV